MGMPQEDTDVAVDKVETTKEAAPVEISMETTPACADAVVVDTECAAKKEENKE